MKATTFAAAHVLIPPRGRRRGELSGIAVTLESVAMAEGTCPRRWLQVTRLTFTPAALRNSGNLLDLDEILAA